jgi:flagellar basal-body rod modification protein FlgD
MYTDTIGSTYQETSPSATAKKDLGRDDFLTLLVAQLKHQDPLNPLESTEFTSQLAQYSSLEQLFNIDQNLELIKSGQDQGSGFQALDFIGKEVVAEGDMLSLEEGKTSKGNFNLDDVADCSVLITDSKGYPVRKISLGSLEPGSHELEWDGRDDAGNMREEGVYGLEITAVTENGQMLTVATQITGQVTSVNLEQDLPIIYVGKIPISMSQVRSIGEP